MRLTTRMHGYTDYVLSAVLLIVPWVMGFGDSVAGVTAMMAGAIVLLLTLSTNFEAGVVKRMEVPVHLWIDGILGLLLALSPWLIGFDRTTWIPHLAAGILLVLLALVTNTVPEVDRRRSEPRI
jgi:hypothetical protein